MKERSRKELEALSAYLDGELSGRERAKLEARLKTDTSLQAVLESLRQTRALLRSTPQMKAPRNFTLTLEMAGARAKLARLYGAMRLVSVMASILFVVVVMGDLVTTRGGLQAFSAADFAESGDADVAEMAAEAPVAEAMEQAAAEEEDMADADAGDSAADDSAADTASEPTGEALGAAVPEVAGTATAAGTMVVEETAADSADAGADDAGDGEEPELTFTAPTGTATVETTLDDQQLDEGQERAITPPEIAEGDGEEVGVGGGGVIEDSPRRSNLLLIFVRVAEVGLALVALGAGVMALAMRRRGR